MSQNEFIMKEKVKEYLDKSRYTENLEKQNAHPFTRYNQYMLPAILIFLTIKGIFTGSFVAVPLLLIASVYSFFWMRVSANHEFYEKIDVEGIVLYSGKRIVYNTIRKVYQSIQYFNPYLLIEYEEDGKQKTVYIQLKEIEISAGKAYISTAINFIPLLGTFLDFKSFKEMFNNFDVTKFVLDQTRKASPSVEVPNSKKIFMQVVIPLIVVTILTIIAVFGFSGLFAMAKSVV